MLNVVFNIDIFKISILNTTFNIAQLVAIIILLLFIYSFHQLLSVLINACCLALMDACVPLSCTFAALACGRTKEGQLLMDPDPSQEEQCQAMCTCVVEGHSGNVLSSHSEGKVSIYQVCESFKLADL